MDVSECFAGITRRVISNRTSGRDGGIEKERLLMCEDEWSGAISSEFRMGAKFEAEFLFSLAYLC